MGSLESAIRLMVIGQALLITTIFLSSAGSRVLRWSAAALMLGVAGYLLASGPALRASSGWILPIATLLAVSVPYSLWLFARAVFDAPWPPVALAVAAVLIGIAGWASNLFGETAGSPLQPAMALVLRATSLAIVVHALWIAGAGRPDDLLEPRRSYRLLFVGIVSAQIIAVLITEVVLASSPPPPWLSLANVIVIAAITIGLAIPLLRLNPELLPLDAGRESAVTPPEEVPPDPATRVYRDKLLGWMAEGGFRKTGLTISQLAAQLDYPEHRLRRLINRHLGYRNFSAFLNSYRIDEAKIRLADPEQVKTPILTIALDLGYASIGPFNRAFKDATGATPSDFRKRELAGQLAESG
jgi:AraC-like DNA-binding protein